MILKDVDEQAALDKYQKAGLSAEKQMAFYLKRAFGNEENVLINRIGSKPFFAHFEFNNKDNRLKQQDDIDPTTHARNRVFKVD